MSENKSQHSGIVLFFVLTFAISWLIWLPSVLASQGVITLPDWVGLVTNIATFGPGIAAIIVVAIKEKKQGVKNLLKKGINIKFKAKWLIPIFILLPLIAGLAFVITVPATGDSWNTSFTFSLLVSAIIMFFIGGPLGEEFGWRGFAQEKLQNRWNALTSSLIVGFFWGIWHLPLHFITGATQEYIPIWAFILLQMVISIIFGWIYNNTRSVLAVIVLHWVSNAAAMLIPYWQKGFIGGVPAVPNLLIPSIGMLVGFGLALISSSPSKVPLLVYCPKSELGPVKGRITPILIVSFSAASSTGVETQLVISNKNITKIRVDAFILKMGNKFTYLILLNSYLFPELDISISRHFVIQI